MNKSSEIFKKIWSILKGLATLVVLVVLLLVVVQRVTKNNIAIGGIRMFTIVSDSMKPDYVIGDILISKDVESKDINVGDRVTYLGVSGDFIGLIVTHEVIDKREKDGLIYFTTQGIANDIADPEITENDVYGKVIYKTTILSFFSRLMTNPIIYYGLFVLVGIYFSYQIIMGFINKDEEEDSDFKLKNKDNKSDFVSSNLSNSSETSEKSITDDKKDA